MNKYTIINPFINYGYNAIHTKKICGDMKDKKNLKNLLDELNVNKIIATANQTHSTNVIIVNKNTQFDSLKDIDGIITNDNDLVLVTFYADCLPLFLLDPTKNVYGILHAGWRGSVNNILKNGIDLMVSEYGSNINDIIVSFGVCISNSVYEIKQDTVDIINNKLDYTDIYLYKDDKIYLDLKKINYNLAVDLGILEQNIYTNNHCSYTEDYHSYRKYKNTERSAAIMYKLEK